MAKYIVYYSGVAFVEAESTKEAEENYEYGIYNEEQVDEVEKVEEFYVSF